MIKSTIVPKSKKGREVVKILKEAGYEATYRTTAGRYLVNLPAYWKGLNCDIKTLIKIAFVLFPDHADWAVNEAAYRTSQIVDNPADYGLFKSPEWAAEYNRQVLGIL